MELKCEECKLAIAKNMRYAIFVSEEHTEYYHETCYLNILKDGIKKTVIESIDGLFEE